MVRKWIKGIIRAIHSQGKQILLFCRVVFPLRVYPKYTNISQYTDSCKILRILVHQQKNATNL